MKKTITTKTRVSIFFEAIAHLRYTKGWYIEIQNTAPWRSNLVECSVNWCACGAVNTKDAREFAERILICSNIADRVNALNLEMSDEDDTLITDHDTYNKFCEVIEDAFANAKYDLFEKFFSLGNDYDKPNQGDDDWYDSYAPSQLHYH